MLQRLQELRRLHFHGSTATNDNGPGVRPIDGFLCVSTAEHVQLSTRLVVVRQLSSLPLLMLSHEGI